MSRRSIHGHSRRRKNRKAGFKKAESSPMKLTDNEEKLMMGAAAGTIDPVSIIATKAYQASEARKEIEEETGRKFRNYRQAKWYSSGTEKGDSQAWMAQMDDTQYLATVIPPESEL